MKVRITEAAGELLSLDEESSAINRRLKITQLYTRTRRPAGYLIEADWASMEKLLEEFTDMASGLMLDGVDNPGVSKRVAATAAARIRYELTQDGEEG